MAAGGGSRGAREGRWPAEDRPSKLSGRADPTPSCVRLNFPAAPCSPDRGPAAVGLPSVTAYDNLPCSQVPCPASPHSPSAVECHAAPHAFDALSKPPPRLLRRLNTLVPPLAVWQHVPPPTALDVGALLWAATATALTPNSSHPITSIAPQAPAVARHTVNRACKALTKPPSLVCLFLLPQMPPDPCQRAGSNTLVPSLPQPWPWAPCCGPPPPPPSACGPAWAWSSSAARPRAPCRTPRPGCCSVACCSGPTTRRSGPSPWPPPHYRPHVGAAAYSCCIAVLRV